MAYYGKVEISGVNTANLPVLTGTEAKALFIKCKAGDEAARQQLIEGNLRLVLSIIKRFENRNENMDTGEVSERLSPEPAERPTCPV